MHIPTFEIIKNSNILFSSLELDCDQAAERVQVLDRNTGVILRHLPVGENGNLIVNLPFSYSISPILMCIILDDNGEFNAAIIDRVQSKPFNIFQT